MNRRPPSSLIALAAELVELDLGPTTAAERASTQRWVEERIAGAGAVTRLGLTASAVGVGAVVRILTGSAYHRLPSARRRAVTARLARTRLPPAADLVRALRSLVLVHLVEQRSAGRQ